MSSEEFRDRFPDEEEQENIWSQKGVWCDGYTGTYFFGESLANCDELGIDATNISVEELLVKRDQIAAKYNKEPKEIQLLMGTRGC